MINTIHGFWCVFKIFYFILQSSAVKYKKGLKNLKGEVLNLLPGEVRVFTTEVPVSCSLAHDGPLQVEVADDATRTEVEILFDNFNQIGIGLPILNSTV